MRLRNIPGAAQVVAESPFVINEPEKCRGRWREYFGNLHPIYIEVGMGKGRFLTEMAERSPEINYIGIERYTSVLLRAVEKAESRKTQESQREPEERTKQQEQENKKEREEQKEPMEAGAGNFRFLCEDAARLAEIFAPGEVDRIYLNFSDPWPKERHAGRRLTSGRFLAIYRQILNHEGQIEFKTDNQELFTFSLESAKEAGWQILAYTRDLHHDSMAAGNVMTEYEEKFSALGNPICKIIIAPGASAAEENGEAAAGTKE